MSNQYTPLDILGYERRSKKRDVPDEILTRIVKRMEDYRLEIQKAQIELQKCAEDLRKI